MNKFVKLLLWLIILAAVGLSAVYFFGDYIFKTYNDNLQKLEETNVGELINEIKKEVFAPSPLNIGGQANDGVFVKSKIIAETNIQRYDNGMLPPLVENARLSQAALAKANDMFQKQYFDHVSPSGVGPAELVKSYGYDYIVTGENLILGNFKDEKEIVKLWMDSPGHRANILNEKFTEIGVAIIKGTYKNQTVWIGVQEFGLPLSNCNQPSQSLKNTIDKNQDTIDQLLLQINEKKEEIDNTNKRSEKYNQLVEEYNQMVKKYNALVQETKGMISQYNSQINAFNQCISD